MISHNNIVENIELDSIKKNHFKQTGIITETRKSIINYLKKKDKKWHLTAHKIKEGENLWLIAKDYKTDYKLIIRANNIKKPDILNIFIILKKV